VWRVDWQGWLKQRCCSAGMKLMAVRYQKEGAASGGTSAGPVLVADTRGEGTTAGERAMEAAGAAAAANSASSHSPSPSPLGDAPGGLDSSSAGDASVGLSSSTSSLPPSNSLSGHRHHHPQHHAQAHYTHHDGSSSSASVYSLPGKAPDVAAGLDVLTAGRDHGGAKDGRAGADCASGAAANVTHSSLAAAEHLHPPSSGHQDATTEPQQRQQAQGRAVPLGLAALEAATAMMMMQSAALGGQEEGRAPAPPADQAAAPLAAGREPGVVPPAATLAATAAAAAALAEGSTQGGGGVDSAGALPPPRPLLVSCGGSKGGDGNGSGSGADGERNAGQSAVVGNLPARLLLDSAADDAPPEPAANLSNRLNPNNVHYDKELAAR
jgi:hypothetical protein